MINQAPPIDFRALLESAPDAMIITNDKGEIQVVNKQTESLFGYPREHLLGQPVEMLMPHSVRAAHAIHRQGYFLKPEVRPMGRDLPLHGLHKEGRVFPVEISLSPLNTHYGRWVCAAVRDVSERKVFEEQQRLASAVLQSIAEGVVLLDANARILHLNHAATTLLSYTLADCEGSQPDLFLDHDQSIELFEKIWADVLVDGYWRGEVTCRRRDGSTLDAMLNINTVRNSLGNIQNYVGLFSDISSMKATQAALENLAHYDSLTGLPNRTLFLGHIGKVLSRQAGRKRLSALLFIDIDNFKFVNDSLGHDAGDRLLIEIARRLKRSCRQPETLARLGGDEFVLFMEDIDEPGAAVGTAERLLQTLDEPLTIGHQALRPTASIGISFYPYDGEDVSQLLQHADSAMYEAKRSGKNRYACFDSEFSRQASRRLSLENELRASIGNKSLNLAYQPIRDLRSGQLQGVEALLRWQRKDKESISPSEFIPIAEASGLILPLGQWILKQAMQDFAHWLAGSRRDVYLSINLSSYQLREPSLPQQLHDSLSASGLLPRQIMLEITEGALIKDVDQTRRNLATLREMKVSIAIDDFGTGYSSLSYLKQLPIDVLKIDQSFIENLDDDPSDQALTHAIISLAGHLGLSVIAEGIERDSQRQLLLGQGCMQGQGYWLGHPGALSKVPATKTM